MEKNNYMIDSDYLVNRQRSEFIAILFKTFKA